MSPEPRFDVAQPRSDVALSPLIPLPVPRVAATNMDERNLELIRIHRVQSGLYRCTAYNGIPPDASKVFQVTVMCESEREGKTPQNEIKSDAKL